MTSLKLLLLDLHPFLLNQPGQIIYMIIQISQIKSYILFHYYTNYCTIALLDYCNTIALIVMDYCNTIALMDCCNIIALMDYCNNCKLLLHLSSNHFAVILFQQYIYVYQLQLLHCLIVGCIFLDCINCKKALVAYDSRCYIQIFIAFECNS